MALSLVVPSWITPPVGLSVSPPFNAVSVVALGLFSVRSRRLACFLAFCTFAMCVLLTEGQASVYVETAWSSTPAADVPEPGGLESYLKFGLARWIAIGLFSAYVARAVYRILPFAELGHYAVICLLGLLLYGIRAPETSALYSISSDSSVRFYFQCYQLAESVRTALQAAFMGSRANVRDGNNVYGQKIHMLTYSALILINNVHSIYSSGGLNLYTVLDIFLQVVLIFYIWLCPVPNGRVQPQRPVMVAQHQPVDQGPPEVPVLHQFQPCIAQPMLAFRGLPDSPVLHDLQQDPFFRGLVGAPIYHNNLRVSPPAAEDNDVPFPPAIPEARYENRNERLETGRFGVASSFEDQPAWLIIHTNYESKPQLAWPEEDDIVNQVVPMHSVADTQNNIGQLVAPRL